MDIVTFADRLKKKKPDSIGLRLIFQCVKSPQYGIGVRFSFKDRVVPEYVYLSTASGDNITDLTLSSDIKVLTNISEFPEPFIVAMGLVIQKVNYFLDGTVSDVSLLSKSNATVNGFLFDI